MYSYVSQIFVCIRNIFRECNVFLSSLGQPNVFLSISIVFLYIRGYPQVFLSVPQKSWLFLDIPMYSLVFIGVPKYSEVVLSIPKYSERFLGILIKHAQIFLDGYAIFPTTCTVWVICPVPQWWCAAVLDFINSNPRCCWIFLLCIPLDSQIFLGIPGYAKHS